VEPGREDLVLHTLMGLAAVVAGLVHIYIFCMESLWWTTPGVRARFRQTPEQAEATRLLAFNQGFYNLFLGAGIFVAYALLHMGHYSAAMTLLAWNCAFMVAAAVVLLGSARALWRGALIQGAAPLAYLVVAAIHAAT
jgi:putative membrane protein